MLCFMEFLTFCLCYGTEIYNKLDFESHIKSLGSKASQKVGTLQRI